jgi:hypothetical protein
MFLERLRRAARIGRYARGSGRGSSFLPAAAESVLIPAAGLALALWLRPRDPFFLAAGFPWIWLAPILMALRHGSAGSLIASLTLAAGWASATPSGAAAVFPRGFFLGGFITGFLCGEFRDLWQAETRRERKSREHLDTRLDELANANQVLAQSHERLMSDFIGHPPTLRDALAEVPRPPAGRFDPEAAQALLVFLARFFQLETAAIHVMEADGLRAAPFAALGPARRLDGRETLIAACLETRALCHAVAEEAAPGPYLFAAPLAPGEGPIQAVLAVERMPFFAFQAENLRGLFAVLGSYMDTFAAATLAARVQTRFPDCPEDFAAGYLRLHRLATEADVPSVLAARFHTAGAPASDLSPLPRRGVDLAWQKGFPGGGSALLILLPFCGEEQGRAALARLHAAPGRDRVQPLAAGDPLAALADFLERLGSDGADRPARKAALSASAPPGLPAAESRV